MLRSLYGYVSAFVFKDLKVSLQTSYRLRGGGYRVYTNAHKPKSKRWCRHWLLAHSPSGILPMPYELWLAFPEIGVLSPYQLGMVRHFIISKLEPKSFNENEVDSLRAYYDGDDEGIMERLLQQWMKMHLKYLHWYASSLFDYSLPLCSLFSPRSSRRSLIGRVPKGCTSVMGLP